MKGTRKKERNMKALVFAVVLIAVPLLVYSQSRTTSSVERGKYIVESVAMCGHCHTPRNGSGELIMSQWLNGAAVPVKAPAQFRSWAEYAPRIAGLTQFTDEQALRLLTGGISRTGTPLRNPMPPYRMSREDAQDVVTYLKSLE
jgi:mono/diheme cytochrome c family protein